MTTIGAAGCPAPAFRNTTSSDSADAEAQPKIRHNVANDRADTAQLLRHYTQRTHAHHIASGVVLQWPHVAISYSLALPCSLTRPNHGFRADPNPHHRDPRAPAGIASY